jgi:tetratricopeptide (TPR) repeat protein
MACAYVTQCDYANALTTLSEAEELCVADNSEEDKDVIENECAIIQLQRAYELIYTYMYICFSFIYSKIGKLNEAQQIFSRLVQIRPKEQSVNAIACRYIFFLINLFFFYIKYI